MERIWLENNKLQVALKPKELVEKGSVVRLSKPSLTPFKRTMIDRMYMFIIGSKRQWNLAVTKLSDLKELMVRRVRMVCPLIKRALSKLGNVFTRLTAIQTPEISRNLSDKFSRGVGDKEDPESTGFINRYDVILKKLHRCKFGFCDQRSQQFA